MGHAPGWSAGWCKPFRICYPQATLCSFGMERGPIRPRDHIASLRRLRELFYWRDTQAVEQTTKDGLVFVNVANLCPPPSGADAAG